MPLSNAADIHHPTHVQHTFNTRALRCRFAFRRGSYYSELSCSAEQYNTQGAVAQLVERFVRIEEVVVSTTISSTKAFRNSTSGRLFSLSSDSLAFRIRLHGYSRSATNASHYAQGTSIANMSHQKDRILLNSVKKLQNQTKF